MKQGGTLVTDPASKADLLNSFFDNKQSRVSIDLPHTCHPETKLSSFAFRARSVHELLMDLDPYMVVLIHWDSSHYFLKRLLQYFLPN